MNPLTLAEELAEAIKASEQYKEFARVKEAMDVSEKALALIEKFQEKQKDLRDSKLQGNKITQEQVAELTEQQKQMLENPEIDAYLAAKKNVEILLAAVNETISRVTGMEAGRGHGHGGSSCGGGCC